jgi:hypothetical protein
MKQVRDGLNVKKMSEPKRRSKKERKEREEREKERVKKNKE